MPYFSTRRDLIAFLDGHFGEGSALEGTTSVHVKLRAPIASNRERPDFLPLLATLLDGTWVSSTRFSSAGHVEIGEYRVSVVARDNVGAELRLKPKDFGLTGTVNKYALLDGVLAGLSGMDMDPRIRTYLGATAAWVSGAGSQKAVQEAYQSGKLAIPKGIVEKDFGEVLVALHLLKGHVGPRPTATFSSSAREPLWDFLLDGQMVSVKTFGSKTNTVKPGDALNLILASGGYCHRRCGVLDILATYSPLVGPLLATQWMGGKITNWFDGVTDPTERLTPSRTVGAEALEAERILVRDLDFTSLWALAVDRSRLTIGKIRILSHGVPEIVLLGKHQYLFGSQQVRLRSKNYATHFGDRLGLAI